MQVSPSFLVLSCEFTSFNKREVRVDAFLETKVAVEPVAGVSRARLESADVDYSLSLAYAARSRFGPLPQLGQRVSEHND